MTLFLPTNNTMSNIRLLLPLGQQDRMRSAIMHNGAKSLHVYKSEIVNNNRD